MTSPCLLVRLQVKELKEFQAREKTLQEEKAKRVAALEAELRGMRALVDEAVRGQGWGVCFDGMIICPLLTPSRYKTVCAKVLFLACRRSNVGLCKRSLASLFSSLTSPPARKGFCAHPTLL